VLDYLTQRTLLAVSFTFHRNNINKLTLKSSRMFFTKELTLHITIFRLFHNNFNYAHKTQTCRERIAFLSSHEIIHNQSFENERRKKESIVTSLYAKTIFFQAKNMFNELISFFIVSRVMTTSSSRAWRLLLALYDS
jgi:hypothetical protein